MVDNESPIFSAGWTPPVTGYTAYPVSTVPQTPVTSDPMTALDVYVLTFVPPPVSLGVSEAPDLSVTMAVLAQTPAIYLAHS